MANPIEPPRAERPAAPDIDYASLPSTGVVRRAPASRRAVDRAITPVRWGSIVAGIVLAIATQAVLGLLGAAVGLSSLGGHAARVEAVRIGAAIWMVAATLIGMFVGGYAAAKLGGSSARGDGLVAGLLTWATTVVLTLFLLGSSAGASLLAPFDGGAARTSALHDAVLQIDDPPDVEAETAAPPADSADAARTAWATFVAACAALLAALVGGAAAAAGSRRDRMLPAGPEEDAERRRLARELDREMMGQEQTRSR